MIIIFKFLNKIQNFIVKTFDNLVCEHEWEDDNWIDNNTCPIALRSLNLYEKPQNHHPINLGMGTMYYYKCKKCGKSTSCEGTDPRMIIFNKRK